MEEAEEQDQPIEQKTTKFQSPIPVLIRLRNVIFGRVKPDIYTRVTFYINLFFWLTFILWNFLGYFAIASRNLIFQMKKIPVEQIIQERGVELGFEPNDFVTRLLVVHGVGILCWTAVFFGLVLLYRKRRQFIYFVAGGTLFYLGMNVFYMSYKYYKEDTTGFDKLGLLIILASCTLHAVLMRNERLGGSIGFFGETTQH